MFRESYETLFNSAPTDLEMENLKKVLNNLIDLAAEDEITKITGEVVKETIE